MLNTRTLRQEYRHNRRLLGIVGNDTAKNVHKSYLSYKIVLLALYALFLIIWMTGCAMADSAPIDINRLANAIYHAEGGSKTRHPYGILAHYKHTTPRQACIHTIKHRLNKWNGQGDFITYLGLKYSPPSINPYWVKNVSMFYYREGR